MSPTLSRGARTRVALGGAALVVLVGGLVAVAVWAARPSPPSPMHDPETPGRQVALSIQDDYCSGTVARVSAGIGTDGQFGFTTINCEAPSGRTVTFGVFSSQESADRAEAAMDRSRCQDNGHLDDVAAAVRGPRWIAFVSDAADAPALASNGGTRLDCP